MTTTPFSLEQADPPIVAVLRGLVPDEAEAIGAALVDAGIVLIEVPLNRPFALDCVRRLVRAVPAHVHVGGGTVVTLDDVDRLHGAGGRMMFAPHCDPGVIAHARATGLVCVPGVMTPSEAFLALRLGAHALKLFPAEALGIAGLTALRSVLPRGTAVWPAGSITPHNLAAWVDAGAAGVVIGPALFRPGMTAKDVSASAGAFVAAWRARAAQ